MIVPSTRIFTAGEVETGAYLNSAVTNMGNFMLGRPIASLRQTSAQSIANSTTTDITWNIEDIDRDNGHSTSSNTERYTAQTAGWYWCVGSIFWAGNATGNRVTNLAKNGTAFNVGKVRNSSTLNSNDFSQTSSALIYMNGTTDYITLQGAQSSGGALSTIVAAGSQSSLIVVWVSL